MLTKHILSATLIAGTLIGSAGISSAMPMVQPDVAASPVQAVGWRCGPGWHMNRWGTCVHNRPVYYRPIHHPFVRVWHRGYWEHHRWHPGFWVR